MPSTIDIRRRIRSVRNTQQITKAMKMVAAAKLRRAQERITATRPYAAALRKVLASVASRVEAEHPLLRKREERRVLLIVITGDKGLCGAFNTNIVKAAQLAIEQHGWQEVQLLPIGRKGNEYFRRRTIPIRHQVVNIFQALSRESVDEIAKIVIADYAAEKIDAVYAVYNEFRSVIQQNLRVERLLPLERIEDPESARIDYLYEPDPQQILAELLPHYVGFQIYRMLLDSAAAEHGARMTAMEAATKNAGEMIDTLTLNYNRIRQAAITKEIIEIVSGASALG
ncbi:MAG: ATP synthase F1 subunit gamma [Thermoanaerobaculia bacterium]